MHGVFLVLADDIAISSGPFIIPFTIDAMRFLVAGMIKMASNGFMPTHVARFQESQLVDQLTALPQRQLELAPLVA